jgi:hypothetical protein
MRPWICCGSFLQQLSAKPARIMRIKTFTKSAYKLTVGMALAGSLVTLAAPPGGVGEHPNKDSIGDPSTSKEIHNDNRREWKGEPGHKEFLGERDPSRAPGSGAALPTLVNQAALIADLANAVQFLNKAPEGQNLYLDTTTGNLVSLISNTLQNVQDKQNRESHEKALRELRKAERDLKPGEKATIYISVSPEGEVRASKTEPMVDRKAGDRVFVESIEAPSVRLPDLSPLYTEEQKQEMIQRYFDAVHAAALQAVDHTWRRTDSASKQAPKAAPSNELGLVKGQRNTGGGR